MIDTYILYLQNKLYIQLPPRKDAQCGFGVSNCYSKKNYNTKLNKDNVARLVFLCCLKKTIKVYAKF